jgi:phage internal scaffolding protein
MYIITDRERKEYMSSPRRVQFETVGKSMTEQSHKDSCDIKLIMRKAEKTGMINHLKRTEGQYVDLIGRPDFHTSMNEIKQAQSMFETIPATVRQQFDNNPQKWLDFVTNPENRESMAEMGFSTDHLPEVLSEPEPVKVIVQNTEAAE